MPDPTRTSRTSKLPKAQRSRAGEQPERQPENQRDDKPKGPLWARAVHRFYDPVFDIRSRKDFQEVLNDFVELTPDERAFHDTHLLYSVVVGLEGIFGVLKRIEERLAAVSGPDLAALEHLAPIRAALEEIASSQPDLVRVDGVDGDEEEDED